VGVGGCPGGYVGVPRARVRLMSVLGMMGGLFFSTVIIAQWIMLLTLPCGAKLPT
jgi:hypothetical protein